MTKGAFRNSEAWPRELIVDGQRLPLTDCEVFCIKQALEAYALEHRDKPGWQRTARALCRFLVSGRSTDEPPAIARWRREVLDLGHVSETQRRR